MLYFLRITDSVLGPHRNCSPDNELLSPPITPLCIVSNIGKTITEGPGRTVRGWLYTWISFPSRLLHRLTLYCTVLYCTVLYCTVLYTDNVLSHVDGDQIQRVPDGGVLSLLVPHYRVETPRLSSLVSNYCHLTMRK